MSAKKSQSYDDFHEFHENLMSINFFLANQSKKLQCQGAKSVALKVRKYLTGARHVPERPERERPDRCQARQVPGTCRLQAGKGSQTGARHLLRPLLGSPLAPVASRVCHQQLCDWHWESPAMHQKKTKPIPQKPNNQSNHKGKHDAKQHRTTGNCRRFLGTKKKALMLISAN